jgi:hypothetical protein
VIRNPWFCGGSWWDRLRDFAGFWLAVAGHCIDLVIDPDDDEYGDA